MFWDREKYFIDKADAFRDAMETATSESERKKLIHNFEKVMKEKDFAEYVCQSATELPFDLLPVETVNKFFSSKEFKKELVNVSGNHLTYIVRSATKNETRRINCTVFNDKFFNNDKFRRFYSNLTPECQKEYIKYSIKPKTIISMATKATLLAHYKAPKNEQKKYLELLIEEKKKLPFIGFSLETQKAIINEFGYDFAIKNHLANVFTFLEDNASLDPEFSAKLLIHPKAQEQVRALATLKTIYMTSKSPNVFEKLLEIKFDDLDNQENKTFDIFAQRFFLDFPENVILEYNIIQCYANDCPEFKEKHKEELNELANIFDKFSHLNISNPNDTQYLKTYNMQTTYDYFLELEKQHKLNPLFKLKYEVKNLFNQELKDNLIDLQNPQTFDREMEHDGVKIHELDGKKFNMMVHTTGNFTENTDTRKLLSFAKKITTFKKDDSYVMSTSLISDNTLGLWGGHKNKLIFGYSSSINPKKIEGASTRDNLSINICDIQGERIQSYANTYLSLDTFKKGTSSFNEINYSVIEPRYDYERLVDKVYIQPVQKQTFAEEITEAIKSKNFTKLETSAQCIAHKITKTVEAESAIFLSQNPEEQKQLEDKIAGIVKHFDKNYLEENLQQPQENKPEEIKTEEQSPTPEKEAETITFKPDFLVCYDNILPLHTDVAKSLGVDIVLINTQKYEQVFEPANIVKDFYKQ